MIPMCFIVFPDIDNIKFSEKNQVYMSNIVEYMITLVISLRSF